MTEPQQVDQGVHVGLTGEVDARAHMPADTSSTAKHSTA